MQVTTQCRVEAPIEWVRSFLIAGTSEDDVVVEGDTVEVRQSDRFLRLVVRNTLTADDPAHTVLDIDARLRLRGFGVVAGTLFRRRLRRTLVRSLDALPSAIEAALDEAGQDLG